MRLSNLLQDYFLVPANADRDIAGITLDSRTIQKNSLFFAVKGTQQDGRHYIQEAIAKGAAAIVLSAETTQGPLEWQQQVPLIALNQLQKKMGEIVARFYGWPAKKLRMIGVTGTSGKTSCTHFIAQSLQALHLPCGVIGTLGSGMYGALGPAGLTTPDAVTLQSSLQRFVAQGAKAVAMEVSSHSIDQERIGGIEFELGLFTNLTQDHLDYHGDLARYAAVKKRFLEQTHTKNVIINAHDAYGRQWIAELATQKTKKTIVAYSISPLGPPTLSGSVPFIYTDQITMTLQGIYAKVYSSWGEGELSLPLIGAFNLSNSLAVLATLLIYDLPLTDALALLSQLKPVPGRMQTLGGGCKPLVVVDYAHKPDALEKALQALRPHTEGKLICMFGCGGERDRSKRPLMAALAEQLADQVVVTNDNPRHEAPADIAADIVRGFSHPERVWIELDRSKAIENSIQWAAAQDCILIAGKGAEHYQQIGDEKIPFDDVEKASGFLRDWKN